jgi:hypothetical protein
MTVTVTQCGRRQGRGGSNLDRHPCSSVGHVWIGVDKVADHVWLIGFLHYDLGFFDDTCNRDMVQSRLSDAEHGKLLRELKVLASQGQPS